MSYSSQTLAERLPIVAAFNGEKPQYSNSEQLARDLLHIYGWVAELTQPQQQYVLTEHNTISQGFAQGKNLESITLEIFLGMPSNMGKVKMREKFADIYKPEKGSLASPDDTSIILGRFQEQTGEKRWKKEISQTLRSYFKQIKQAQMRKQE